VLFIKILFLAIYVDFQLFAVFASAGKALQIVSF